MSNFKVPTEWIDLPSKGLVYPAGNPLKEGKLELRYPGARQDDILTNINYAKQGILMDVYFKSLIVTPINYDDLLLGDQDMIMVAARILGDGSEYIFDYTPDGEDKPVVVKKNLQELQDKPIHPLLKDGVMEYPFELPVSKLVVTVKLLTHKDEVAIDKELKGWQKLKNDDDRKISTRLKHTIVAINGNRSQAEINDFIDSGALIKKDLIPLRQFISDITPGIDFKFDYTRADGEVVEGLSMPITMDFFWPKSRS